MTFHMAAYFETHPTGTNVDINALQDDILNIENNHFVLRENPRLLAAGVNSANASAARLNSPSLRRITQPYLSPIVAAEDGGQGPQNPTRWPNGFLLPRDEEIAAEVTDATGGDVTIGVCLESQRVAPPAGSAYTLRGTTTSATVADTWTSITTTWESSLPAGKYALLGGSVRSATGRLWRANLNGQLDRPGGFCVLTTAEAIWWWQRMGRLGSWGEFDARVMPEIQVLAGAAETPAEILIDIAPL